MLLYKIFKEPLCPAQMLECVNKIQVDTSSCMKPCTGLIVTSFDKSENHKDLQLLYPKVLTQYNNYKTISEYPPGLVGKVTCQLSFSKLIDIYFSL